jgi:hypothetical protein
MLRIEPEEGGLAMLPGISTEHGRGSAYKAGGFPSSGLLPFLFLLELNHKLSHRPLCPSLDASVANSTVAYVNCALESACACSQQPHRPCADQVAVASSLIRWYLPIQISSLERLRLKNPNDVKMAKAATIYRHPPLRVSESEHSPWPSASTSMSSVGYCSWSSANSISISVGESLAQRENPACLRNPSPLQEFLLEFEEGTSAETNLAEHDSQPARTSWWNCI